ncbi:MAG: chorismate mutase [Halobacteria archaeon]|nr:chorismate mutase [Halobacteria archaeon]
MEKSPGKGPKNQDKQQRRQELDELRAEIEEIDREIVDNIARRTYLAESIARAKADLGLEVDDPDREREVIEHAVERAENLGIDDRKIADVFRVLIEMSKKEQREWHD